MDFNTRYLASGYVAIYLAPLDWLKETLGIYACIYKYVYKYIYIISNGNLYKYVIIRYIYIHARHLKKSMAKCIKSIIWCDRATSYKQRDFLSRWLSRSQSLHFFHAPQLATIVLKLRPNCSFKLSTRIKPNLIYISLFIYILPTPPNNPLGTSCIDGPIQISSRTLRVGQALNAPKMGWSWHSGTSALSWASRAWHEQLHWV